MGSPRRKAGVLATHVQGYRAWLTHRGYTPGTVRNMLRDLGQVGVWLSAEGLDASQFNEEWASAFLTARRAAGCRHLPGPRAMVPLLSYLREASVVPPVGPAVTPLGELLERYRSWIPFRRASREANRVGRRSRDRGSPRAASRRGSTRGQFFFSSSASITMMPLGPRT